MKLAQELKNRELDLLGRELKIIMSNAPTPVKRRGRIGTSKLKVRLIRINRVWLIQKSGKVPVITK